MSLLTTTKRVLLINFATLILLLPLPADGLAKCTPADDIQFIIDDSFSMTQNDPANLRIDAVKMLIGKQTNQNKFAGAIEFHAFASEIFPPRVISSQLAEMQSKLDAAVISDGGGTNYNDAWDLANAVDSLVKARIFLTDGIPTEGGDYKNGHSALKVPVYAVGFGDSGEEGNSKLLARIASESKGKYFKQTTADNLTAVVNEIDAIINCRAKPHTFNDRYEKGKKRPGHAVGLTKKTKTVDVVISWSNPANSFDIASIKVLKGKKVVGTAAASKLKVTKSSGRTYVTVQVTNIKRGDRFKYTIKAKKLSGSKAKVTSQISLGS